jgi:YidC/Oxa1 family membrane protein insertase
MEKRVLIAVILSIAVMYVYSYLFPAPKPVVEPGKGIQKAVSSTVSQPIQVVKKQILPVAVASPAELPEKDVVVDTDLYSAVFSTRGAALKKFVLKNYRVAGTPGAAQVTLISEALPVNYSMRAGAKGFALPVEGVYSVNTGNMRLDRGAKGSLEFRLTTPEGLSFKKTYTIHGDSYAIDLDEQLVNGTPVKQEGVLQLIEKTHVDPAQGDSRFETHGPVILTDNSVQMLKLSDLAKGAKQYDKGILWSGYADKYFLAAVLAREGSIASVHLQENQKYVEDIVSSPQIALNPGETRTVTYRLYFGPKDLDILKAQGARLEEVIDFGWFSAIAKPLLYSLKFFYKYTGNYGIAIIIITVIIKILFYPLTFKSYKSMKEMQKIQPMMTKLKEKYKDDRDGMNRAVMELYKEHKVNPLGGCLPMLVQMPIFIALYRALMSSIELRHAPFMLWIHDLSAKDPYYVTPIVMGATMFIQQKMTPPTGMDPMQAKMMMALPVVFTVMFINLPSGLVLYWLVNNVLTIAQQAYINKLLKE